MRTRPSEGNYACPAPAPRQPRGRRTAAAAASALALAAPLAGAASARAGATVTISPLRGTPAALPQTQISFLGAPARTLSAIPAVGPTSGRPRGRPPS